MQVATIFDAIYTLDAGYLAPAAAAHMTTKAKELVEHSERILVPSEFVGAEREISKTTDPDKIKGLMKQRDAAFELLAGLDLILVPVLLVSAVVRHPLVRARAADVLSADVVLKAQVGRGRS